MTIKKLAANLLVFVMLSIPVIGFAKSIQNPDWSQGLSSYEKFIVYPHLERAFRAMDDHELHVAISEFYQARKLSKNQPQISLYLADAYEKNDQLNEAIAVLDQLSKENPQRQDIQQALIEAKTKHNKQMLQKIQDKAIEPVQLQSILIRNKPDFTEPYDEHKWIEVLAGEFNKNKKLLLEYQPKFKVNEIFHLEESIKYLIATQNRELLSTYIKSLSRTISNKPNELDAITYQLIQANSPNQAIQLLIDAYPYLQADDQLRQTLTERLAFAQAVATNKNILIDFIHSHKPDLSSPQYERQWLGLLAAASHEQSKLLLDYKCEFDANKAFQAELVLQSYESNPGKITATQVAKYLPHVETLHPTQLDQISYRLNKEGAKSTSFNLLMDAYPFGHADPGIRKVLFDRLNGLLNDNPKMLTHFDLVKLARPLGNVQDRSSQAKLLDSLNDCEGVEQVLEDYSVNYSAEDWRRLGRCYQKLQKVGLAQYAYTQAYQRDQAIGSARELAYQAFETKDYRTSLEMWKKVLASKQSTTADLKAAAYTAVSVDDMQWANRILAEYAKRGGRRDDEYLWLKAITEQQEHPKQALIDIRRAIKQKPKVEYFELLAALERKQKNEAAALEALKKALALNTENSSVQAALGYAYYHQNDVKTAETYLDEALKMRPDDSRLVEQLAYVNQRLGQNEQATRFTERAIDQIDLYTKTEMTPELEDKRFGLRRMHEDLQRRWTFSADAISGNQVASVPNAPQPGLNYKSYAQAEVAYRLGNPAIDDGKTFSAYSRVFAGNGPSGSALPIYAPVIAAGFRWKPFSTQVINFAVEQQFPLDQGSSPSTNTLIRASGSFFNSGKYSDEWHPSSNGWLAQNLYLDAAYYISNRLSSLTADYRVSYHNKMGESQTIEPYTHIQWNSLNQQTQADIRAGVGVRWNIWGNESRYNAYASKVTVGIEFQYALSTYLNDKSTAMLTLGGRW